MTISARSTRKGALAARRRGAAVVEMAVAAPVIFLILFGLFEVAYAFMVQHLIQDAARHACRLAALPRSTNAEVLDAADQWLRAEGVAGATTTILVNDVEGDVSRARSGDEIRVQIAVAASRISIIPRGYLNGQLMASFIRRRE